MGAYIFLFTVFPNNDIIFQVYSHNHCSPWSQGEATINIKDSMNLTEMRCILHKNSSRDRNVNFLLLDCWKTVW